MLDKIEDKIIEDIEKAKVKIMGISSNKTFNKKELFEISFLINFDKEIINTLFKELKFRVDLEEFQNSISNYQLNSITIIKFLILNHNLKFNYDKAYSNNRTRFDNQIKELKKTFDTVQEYSCEQDYRDIPIRELDLVYGFREFLTRYNFCTDEAIRTLLSIIDTKYEKLPRMPIEWEELNSKWRKNIVNSLEEFQEQYKNKINLSDKEIEEYSKNFFETVKRTNQYKSNKCNKL